MDHETISADTRRELLSMAFDDELFEEIQDMLYAVETGQLTAGEAASILLCRMA